MKLCNELRWMNACLVLVAVACLIVALNDLKLSQAREWLVIKSDLACLEF